MIAFVKTNYILSTGDHHVLNIHKTFTRQGDDFLQLRGYWGNRFSTDQLTIIIVRHYGIPNSGCSDHHEIFSFIHQEKYTMDIITHFNPADNPVQKILRSLSSLFNNFVYFLCLRMVEVSEHLIWCENWPANLLYPLLYTWKGISKNQTLNKSTTLTKTSHCLKT